MKVIVVYDIPEEWGEVRRRLREALKNMGGVFRQLSVYEIDLEPRELPRLVEVVKAYVESCGGRAEIIQPCARCYAKIRSVGARGGLAADSEGPRL